MALPDPVAVAAVVVNDPATRTLSVRPAEQRGQGAVLWRQAHREFEEDLHFRHYGYTPPPVPGHTPSRREAAQGALDIDGSIRFHFPLRDPAYGSWSVDPSPRLLCLTVQRGRSWVSSFATNREPPRTTSKCTGRHQYVRLEVDLCCESRARANHARHC